MKRLALLLILAAGPAVADECDAAAKRVAAEMGGTVLMRIGNAIKLQHPDATNYSVECQGSRLVNVAGSRKSGSMGELARLIARTSSAVLGVREQAAADVMLACVRRASRGEMLSKTSGGGVTVSCAVQDDYAAFEVKRR